MLHLVTGTPGAGKTLFTLAEVYGEKGEKELDRPIYIDGIETDLPHERIDGKRWHLDAQDGAIIIIDEAQRIFRPRPRGAAVPEYFAEIETHRHRGIDIWLVTQDAFLIDAHVRRLAGEYFRIDRPGSMRYLRVRRYEEVPSYDNKNGPIETLRKKHPKALYDRYKSTTMDTHRAKIPIKLWFYLAFVLIALGGVGWVVFSLFNGGIFGESDEGKESGLFAAANREVTGGVMSSVGVGGAAPIIADWEQVFMPEVAGMPWTAPAYREAILDEVVPPLPAGCVAFTDRVKVGRIQSSFRDCRCYTARGVRLEVEGEFCRAFVDKGWHDPTGGRFGVTDDPGPLQYADPSDVPGSAGSGSADGGLVLDGPAGGS